MSKNGYRVKQCWKIMIIIIIIIMVIIIIIAIITTEVIDDVHQYRWYTIHIFRWWTRKKQVNERRLSVYRAFMLMLGDAY